MKFARVCPSRPEESPNDCAQQLTLQDIVGTILAKIRRFP